MAILRPLVTMKWPVLHFTAQFPQFNSPFHQRAVRLGAGELRRDKGVPLAFGDQSSSKLDDQGASSRLEPGTLRELLCEPLDCLLEEYWASSVMSDQTIIRLLEGGLFLTSFEMDCGRSPV